MLGRDTDRDWQRLGELEPYWAVATDAAFQRSAMTDAAALDAFLASGRQYLDHVWQVIESHFGTFAPRTALDFGCGVGRVTIPLSERCESVVGVDVSEGMLAEARTLCDRLNVRNVQFVTSDDTLSAARGPFDLVHTYIVLQHIPPDRGLHLLARLTERIADHGIGVLHVLYANPDTASFMSRVLKPLWRGLTAPFRRVPQMQMYAYPLNEVFRIVQAEGARQIHVLPTDHGGCLGVVLCFRKVPGAPYLA